MSVEVCMEYIHTYAHNERLLTTLLSCLRTPFKPCPPEGLEGRWKLARMLDPAVCHLPGIRGPLLGDEPTLRCDALRWVRGWAACHDDGHVSGTVMY